MGVMRSGIRYANELHAPIIDFDNPQGSLKGIIAAAYSLGAILSLPLIPIVNDKFGRRWSIFGGSLIMVIGALIQGFSQHGEHPIPLSPFFPHSASC